MWHHLGPYKAVGNDTKAPPFLLLLLTEALLVSSSQLNLKSESLSSLFGLYDILKSAPSLICSIELPFQCSSKYPGLLSSLDDLYCFFKLITLLTSSVVLLVAGDMMFPSNSDAFIDFDFVFVVNFVTFLLLLLILDSLSYNSSKKVVFFLFLVADEYDGVALLIFLVTRLRFCFLP